MQALTQLSAAKARTEILDELFPCLGSAPTDIASTRARQVAMLTAFYAGLAKT